MSQGSLIIAPGKEKAILRRHPWIFSGAVQRVVGNPAAGDLVQVRSADGRWLAVGHYQDDSIICKVLSFDTPDADEAFFARRIDSAVRYRERMGFFDADGTDIFRLVNGEGDFLPSLICDYYNGVLVMQAHSEGMHRLFPLFVKLFRQRLGERLVALFDKSSATLPASSRCADGYLWTLREAMPDEWEAHESGNTLLINFLEGQKTGFFIDQRDNRNLLASLSGGKRVLNCFGYTGGFSLAALGGGAGYVETVDISRRAIELCDRNVELNYPHANAEGRHRGVVGDVLRYLDEMDDMFDIVVLDPPAFAKSHRNLQQGLKGYRTINTKTMQRLRPGGLLLTFSCSQAVSRDDFQTMAFSAAAMAHREVRIVRTLPHAADHPVSIYHPEGEYLKGLLLQVD